MELQLKEQYVVGEIDDGNSFQIYSPEIEDEERIPVLAAPTECREFAYDYCKALNQARRERAYTQPVGK